MADYSEKYFGPKGVKWLWDKINSLFVRKDGDKVLSDVNFSNEDKEKLDSLENYTLPIASETELGGIKLGEGLEADEDGVVRVTVQPKTEISWADVTDKPTTVEELGIDDVVSQEDLNDFKDEIVTEISGIYKYRGTVAAFEDLENISEKQNGDVYDVSGTGMNYAWNEDEGRWDALGQLFNMEELSIDDIDIIIGNATSEDSLKKILGKGGKVELDADITLTGLLNIGEDSVIDLSGHTLSSSEAVAINVDGSNVTLKNGTINGTKKLATIRNGGTLTIESGDYKSGDVAFQAIGEGSKVVFDNGEITAVEGGLMAFDGAEVEMNGGKVEVSDNFPIGTNGSNGRGGNKIIMNGGELIGNIVSNGYEAIGVYIANNDTFVMNGGKITANGGAGILMRAGYVTINDGEIIATTGPNVPGYIGDKKKKMSASAIIYDEASNYPGKAGMKLEVKGGTIVGADHAIEILSNEAEPNVSVIGGEFTPAYPET